jgi:hypothetical protein
MAEEKREIDFSVLPSSGECTYRVHTIKYNGFPTPFVFADYKCNLIFLIDIKLFRLSTKYDVS